ncbi:MAG: PP0621 family protein [Rhodocyclaceae bacterium]|nr:PP0621 family protein [Rhodocyclaceae bacterium]
MLKAILLIAVIIGLICWWGGFCRRTTSSRQKLIKDPEIKNPERIVACSVCGMHVPESEALNLAGRYFCCEAHRQQADGQRPD